MKQSNTHGYDSPREINPHSQLLIYILLYIYDLPLLVESGSHQLAIRKVHQAKDWQVFNKNIKGSMMRRSMLFDHVFQLFKEYYFLDITRKWRLIIKLLKCDLRTLKKNKHMLVQIKVCRTTNRCWTSTRTIRFSTTSSDLVWPFCNFFIFS